MSFRPISRRTMLAGLGASLSLPWLESMTPRISSQALAAGSSGSGTPKRFAFFFVPNGVIVPSWKPEGTGRDYQLSETLKELEPHRDYFSVVSGFAHDNARGKGDGAGDHARCAATFLTGARPLKSSTNIRLGRSIDQVLADTIGKSSRLPSLELGLEHSRAAGSCDSGYSCAYSSNISWRNETTPSPKEIQPRAVFERLFKSSQANDPASQERLALRRSILDVAAASSQRLQSKLSRTDRQKLDEYFTSIREIEMRLDRYQLPSSSEVPSIDVPEKAPKSFVEYAHLMLDLLVLAFQTETTSVATMMLANAGSNRAYPEIGVPDGHHQLSHHQGDQEKIDKIRKIDRILIQQFGYFLQKMKETNEGESNLLDNSVILYGSAISDGNRHKHDELPIVIAGKGSGRIPTGEHIALSSETPLANFYLSLAQWTGAPLKRFGDSSGTFLES